MLPSGNDDFLRMAGQQAMAHLLNNTFNGQSQQQQQQQQLQHNYSRPPSRGGWDRDGGQRRGYDQRERGPSLGERVDKLMQMQQQQQQQQQQLLQQLQQAPATNTPAPTNLNTPMASAHGGYQLPTQNVPPPPTEPHDIMPSWARTLMDQCTSMHRALESVEAKITTVHETSNTALSMARDTNTTLLQHSTRIDQAHTQISTLANTIESVKRSVDLLDRKVSRPNCALALAEDDIKQLKAKVNRMTSLMQHNMHADAHPIMMGDGDDEGSEHDKDEDGNEEGNEEEQPEAEAGEEITPGPPAQKARPQRPSRATKGTAARRGKRTSGEGATGARKERRTSLGSDV